MKPCKSLSGDMRFNPQGDSLLEAGHILVVVRHRGQLKQVKKMGRAEEK